MARVGSLGGGGAGGVGVGLDGGEVGEEGEGVVISLVLVRLDTDRDLLVRPGLVWTGLRRGRSSSLSRKRQADLPYTSFCVIISHSGVL